MIRTFEVTIEYPDTDYLYPGYNQDIQEMIDADLNQNWDGRIKVRVKETTL